MPTTAERPEETSTRRAESAPPVYGSRWLLRLALILALYAVLDRWAAAAGNLPFEAYEQHSLLAGFVLHQHWTTALIAGSYGLLVLLCPAMRSGWSVLDNGRFIRILVLLSAGLLAWAYSTYDFNLSFDRSHLDARLAIVALAVLCVWRPLFIPFFALLIVTLLHQFHYPIGSDSVAEQSLFISLLVVAWACFVVRVGDRRAAGHHEPVYLIAILVAAGYWTCGFGKLRIDWISFGHIHFLLHATYPNGWLAPLSPEQLTSLSLWLAKFDWPLRIATLLIEVGALAVLWRRWSAAGLFAGWALFHCGVFALSGIFFWRWILLDLCLMTFFLFTAAGRRLPFFRPLPFAVSILLVGTGKFLFHPVNLSWYNSPLSYTFRFEGETEDGRRYSLPPGFFAPYDYPFTMGAFKYLVPEPLVPVSWGAVFERPVAEKLLAVDSLTDVRALERKLDRSAFDPKAAASFDDFVRRFVRNFEARGYRRHPLSFAQPPPLLVTFPPENPFRGQARIARVRVLLVTSLFDGQSHRALENRLVREIEIPRGDSG